MDGRSYSGKIYDCDFDMTYKSLRYIAERIASDMRFDYQCKRASEQREKFANGFYLEKRNQNNVSYINGGN